ncbi:MAG: A/G-specific adenine glycosylase [Anaerolineae bacterium]|nr:A/G-specific adenine glycosylase [Anaerolineae bacterium]
MTDLPEREDAEDGAGRLAEDLLAWFARERRDLPWRRTRDPYHIWVAEIMLVQTQVATVIPYHERFLARFPDVATLARAPLDEVLKAWEGLGYYARARNLHRAAREVLARHGGRIPSEPETLRSLPGVGDYVAGALLSIAFGQDEVALDGNVRRVLSRLFHVSGAPSSGAALAELRERARAILPRGRAGAFNQALMDLGAGICTPRRPRCAACPIEGHCQARQRGDQEELPSRRRRPRMPHFDVGAAVIWRGGQVLIAQRPAEGLLGGLWEFPGGKRQPGETLPECLRREIREELGVEVEVGEPVASVEHAFTHFRITLHAFHCRLSQGEPQPIGCADWRWVELAELERFAFSAADCKVIAALRPSEGSLPGG